MISADQGQYNKKSLVKYLAILGVVTLLSHFTHGYIAAVLPIFILTALAQRKPSALLFWIMTLIFFSVGNRYFFPQNTIAMLATRGTLLSVTVILMCRVAGMKVPRFIHPMLGVFLYIAWEALVSIQGYSPGVSYMKLILFVPIYLSLYGLACEVTASSRTNAKHVRTVVLALAILIIGGSVVLLRIPSIGQMTALNANLFGGDVAEIVSNLSESDAVSLFCGMCAHSQALGPVVAVLSTLIFADYVFAVRRKDWIYLGLLLACPILVYKTSSRTAMATYLAGMGLVVFLFMQARAVGRRWKGKVLMAVFALGVCAGAAAIALPSVRERALGFVLKFSGGGGAQMKDLKMDDITSSRQGLVEMSLAGFRDKPLLGNGFQVGWWMKYQRRRGLKDYLSAPIEKGVWPTAILEEGGVIGFVFFAGFLLVAIVTLIQRHSYCGACVLWTFMIANFGEFSFFSMSYIGGFEWALVFVGLILDGQRLKTVGLQLYQVVDLPELAGGRVCDE